MDKYAELKMQVELELNWAKVLYMKDKVTNPDKLDFDRGVIFAYESIMSKINDLERSQG